MDSKVSIYDFVTESLVRFGVDVNTNRQLPNVFDGLKPVYRRAIYTAIELGNRMKTVTLAGTCISRYHAHGESSILMPISELVQSGILGGKGNHGMKVLRGDNIKPAAPRYTEVWISDKYNKLFSSLLPYVDYKPSELDGFTEPVYLPTPVPLCFLTGLFGLGFGVNTRVPLFSPKSLIDAYYANNPKLLKPSVDLELDYDDSELDSLWNTGIGKVTYRYHVKGDNSASGFGYYLSGSPLVAKPDLSELEKLVESGKIFINDETDGTGNRLFISRNYNVKSLPWEELESMVKRSAVIKKNYRLTVSDNSTAYLIPLKSWIEVTLNNYLRLIEELKLSKIRKYKFEESVYENLPRVAEFLFNNRDASAADISNNLSIDLDVVKNILSKSINTLRKSENNGKLESIRSKLDYYKNLVSKDYMLEIINQF